MRCVITLILGMAPALPGFFYTCINSKTDNSAVRIFQISWFVCAPISLIIYSLLNFFWPVAGLGIQEFINPEDNPRTQAVLEGETVEPLDEKRMGVHEASKDSSVKGEDSSV